MISYSQARIVLLTALTLLLPSTTYAATLGFSSRNVSVDAGSSFIETIQASSANQALNAISGTLTFPPDLLQVISVEKTNSILSLWIAEPTFSNADGTISFSGIVPNPGYIGSSGRVFSVQFRAKREGVATIVFSPSSQVLANDGSGTDILSGTQSALVTVAQPEPAKATQSQQAPVASLNTDLAPHITSSTHPDETRWYTSTHASFDWTNAQGVSAVRLGYDKNAEGKPGVVYTDPISHKELDLADGIWYFHAQEKGVSGWGPTSTFKVQIDTVPPLSFILKNLTGTSTESGNPTIFQFTTTDDLSGIDHYQLTLDGKESAISTDEGNKPYGVLADAGAHVVIVKAFDKAGNVTSAQEAFTVLRSESPKPSLFAFGWLAINYLTLLLVLAAILLTLLFGMWYIKVHFSAYRRNLNRRLGLTHAHVHKQFDSLKDALTEEILKLEQVKSARTLTREETRLITRFKTLLDQSEKEIEKEIEDLPR